MESLSCTIVGFSGSAPASAEPPFRLPNQITDQSGALSGSDRSDVQDALDRLRARGLVYACFCTRADIAQSLTAPHGDAAASYPGTCRALPDDPERRATTPHCWRLNSAVAIELANLPEWTEADGNTFSS